MKNLIILSLVLGLTGLAGCSYFTDSSNDSQSDMCKAMKRQMIYNSHTNAADARYIAPSQNAELKEKYEEYGCK